MCRLLLFLITALIGLVPMPSQAITFTVNSTADIVDANPGNGVCETAAGSAICTLRAAIQEANSYPGADAVIVPSGTYQLVLTPNGNEPPRQPNVEMNDLDILDNLTITGAGVNNAIINGPSFTYPDGTVWSDRIFEPTFRTPVIRN